MIDLCNFLHFFPKYKMAQNTIIIMCNNISLAIWRLTVVDCHCLYPKCGLFLAVFYKFHNSEGKGMR